MAYDYFKGVNKVRRTEGTKIYHGRNFIALAVLGFGVVSGLLMYNSPTMNANMTELQKDWFTTPESRARAKLSLEFTAIPGLVQEELAKIREKRN